MIAERFMRWKGGADVVKRAAGASALGRAYLQCEMDFEDRCGAEAAMTTLLDDPSPKVRLALAEAIAPSRHAPDQIIAALARDQFEIASLVVARSPVLRNADLIDLATTASPRLQTIIAKRPEVARSLATAIAHHGAPAATAALAANVNAQTDREALETIVSRHSGEADVRGAMLGRRDLPAVLRYRLTRATGQALTDMPMFEALSGGAHRQRVTSDALSRALLHLIDDTGYHETSALIAEMRETGDLTTTLLVRAACHGKMDFLARVLGNLAGQHHSRVTGILVQERKTQLKALLTEAGIADSVQPVFMHAIALWRAVALEQLDAGSQEVTRMVMDRVEREHEFRPDHANDDIGALLRSIYLDTMRDNARRHAYDLVEAA